MSAITPAATGPVTSTSSGTGPSSPLSDLTQDILLAEQQSSSLGDTLDEIGTNGASLSNLLQLQSGMNNLSVVAALIANSSSSIKDTNLNVANKS